jgi:uncharacterized protein (DUF885 family)
MVERLEARRQLEICRLPLWASISHMEGWHLELPGLAAEQPVATEPERRAAIERWSSLGLRVDQEIANARSGLREGYSSPRPVVRKVIRQLDAMLGAPAGRPPLHSPADRSGDAAFRQAFGGVVEGPVKLALSRYRDFLKTEYLPKAREALGVSAHPNGKACYAAFLRRHTTTTRPPEEVYLLGQQAVARSLAEVAELGKRHFGTSDIAEIVKRLPQDPRNRFRSEEELIAFSRQVVASAVEKSRPLFARLPEQPMHVEPFPEVQRGSGRSAHYEPSFDPAKPAYYRINSEAWPTETRGNAEVAAVHEGVPGHHLQISRALSRTSHPTAKLMTNAAFVEGWGRYAEELAEQAGIYRTPHALIARRLWPARGMVADPGLHVFGWSREKVVDYFIQSGRFARADADDLVDRMAILPGQLTAYDSGLLELMALRREAQAALGSRFDIRSFHEVVLGNGPVPLRTLRALVAEWTRTVPAHAQTPSSILRSKKSNQGRRRSMKTTEVEQFAALAENWREARAINDHAASEAFEDELYARLSEDEIGRLTGPEMPEERSGDTDGLQSVLQRMWNNASARLD